MSPHGVTGTIQQGMRAWFGEDETNAQDVVPLYDPSA